MNKRENAIWKLVVFLGLLILVLNIFSVIGNNEELVSSINGTDCNLESKNGCGIINYFYEFLFAYLRVQLTAFLLYLALSFL